MIQTAFIKTSRGRGRYRAVVALRKIGSKARKKPHAYLGVIDGARFPRACKATGRISDGDVWAWVRSQGFEAIPADDPGV